MTETNDRRRTRRAQLIAALITCFYAGAIVDWWLRERAAGLMEPRARPAARGNGTLPGGRSATAGETAGDIPLAGTVGSTGSTTVGADEIARHRLRVPIDGADVAQLKGSFDERRAPDHAHEAVDVPAPRNTPVHAVDDGSIAKLFLSKAGGRTIYQFDSTQRFAYYYAHLERYAEGLRDGQRVSRGDVIGYVGSSGNAPPGAPHLHFGVFELTAAKHWWQGRPIDPYPLFRR